MSSDEKQNIKQILLEANPEFNPKDDEKLDSLLNEANILAIIIKIKTSTSPHQK